MRDSISEKEMVFLRMTPKVVHWPSHIYICTQQFLVDMGATLLA